MPDIRWEVLRYYPTITWAAIGDPDLVHELPGYDLPEWPSVTVGESGAGMLFAKIASDYVPLEIGYRGKQVVGVRLEGTSDVRDVEAAGDGRWEEIGQVHIGASGALVRSIDDGTRDEDEIPLPQGVYRAEIIAYDGDLIGHRLILMEPTSQPEPG